MTWLCVTLGVAIGSALLPLISIEVFLLGLVTSHPGMSPWALGAVIAVGQISGKMLYFLAARGSLKLPNFLHRKRDPDAEVSPRRALWLAKTARVRGWLSRLRDRCHRHPQWMIGTHAVSSLVGIPPFMATTVLAGLADMSITAFVTTGVIGRFIRFTVLAASPALFAGWMHLHHH
ncbi:hypothetical protein F0L68_22440 [Solihabitans fulvus]|uniref:Membrane protein YqaA, SNARE-associated domain n=1 Tax=Solihabitans fulvus TaxID=1892852 RepID=A0A5B2X6N0_9PSEU|nr:hypothetical protein F0L68_22440 [Solihabitans fulvus]